jgi:hypothetical protein
VPKFLVTSPSGKKYEVNGPPGATLEQAIAYAKQLEAQQQEEEKGGVVDRFMSGLESMISSGRAAIESLSDAEKAALAAAERNRERTEKYGPGASLEGVEKAFEERGVLGAAGEVVGSIPGAIAEQVPQMGATMAGAAAGSAIFAPLGPVGALVGSTAGAVAPSFLQQYGSNIQRQAEEDIAAGRDVDISRTAAAAAAVPQAALDVASQFIVVGRVLGKKLFGEFGKKIDDLLAKGDTEAAEKLAKEGLAKTVAKGTTKGVFAEGLTEAAQQALERAQAGLPLTTDDAFREYGEVAYQTALVAPLGAVGRLASRSAARDKVREAAPPADIVSETQEEIEAVKKEQEAAAKAAEPPLPTSFEGASPELRSVLNKLNTPKEAAEALKLTETELERLSIDLADPAKVEENEEVARKTGLDPVEVEQRLLAKADRLKEAIPYIRLRLQELSGTPVSPPPAAPVPPIPQTATAQQQLIQTPPPVVPTTPATPITGIPQVAGAQQTLQIDQPLAAAIGVPGAETAPKTQPVTVPAPSGGVAPIPQAAGAQVALPMEPTTVEDPLYRQAVEVVLQSGNPAPATIQKALNVGLKKATELLKRMELEGVVTPIKKGKRSITMGQPREAPSVSVQTTPTVTETPDVGTVGRSPELPLPGPEPVRPEVAPVESERVEPAPRVAADVAPRTERVEPALEPLELMKDGIEGREVLPEQIPNGNPAFQYAVGKVEEDGGIAVFRRRANERGTYGGWRVETDVNKLRPLPQRADEQVAPKFKISETDVTDDDLFRTGQVPPSPVMAKPDVEQAANEAAQGWTNAPEIVVLDDENDARIPQGVQIKPNTKGFYKEGKTYVIASRANDRADVHATVLHESLGHFGLRQKFRTRLDDILNDIYDTNPATRAAADAVKLPGMSNAQAVEEVLASKAEAGPIKEAGIRAAFNRVAAFIRRAGRAMGIKFAYSNNDVAQVLRLAQEKVTKGRREVVGLRTVAQAKKLERDLLNLPVEKLRNLGKLNVADRVERTLAVVEQMGDKARPAFLALRSLPELVEIFGKKLPALKGLMRGVIDRAVKLRETRDQIGANLNKWTEVLSDKQYRGAVIQRFNRIALESTEKQIDFRPTIVKNGVVVRNPDYKSLDPLTKEFERLPQPLQDVYFEMVDAYRKMADRYLELITQNLPPTAANILRREVESRRLKVYLPLYREGEYWLRYQDRNNDTVVEAYTSNRARVIAKQELIKAGIPAASIQTYKKIEDAMGEKGPGAGTYGFFSEINSDLEKYYKDKYGIPVPVELKNTLYKTFLDSIPASSVRQQFRKREGLKGAETEMLKVYAIVASRMAGQLSNLEFTPQLDQATKLLKEDVAKDGSMTAQQVEAEIGKRLSFLREPTYSKWVNTIVFWSYFDFIMGNISSAVTNITNIGTTVYPLLGGEYGYAKTSSAIQDAMAMFMQGGWDNDAQPTRPKKFPQSDRTAFDPAKIPPNSPLGRLYKSAIQQGAIKHSTAYDISEARDRDINQRDYMGMLNYSKQVLGWTFQNTERFNREVTMIAAFRLEMEKNRLEGRTGRAVEQEAIDKAIRLAEKANSETLTELSPRVFQHPLLKIALTFKRYARAMYALQLSLLRDALEGSRTDTTGMNPQEKAEAEAVDREFRKVAIKQWLGTVGGAFVFAGIQGLPFYGLATTLAAGASAISAAMFGDADDEITDPEEDLKQAIGSLAMRGPVSELLGVDIASRTGFNGMFWRDDPRRLDEIGLELFIGEQFLGAPFASIRSSIFDAGRDFRDGYIIRGLEKFLPVAGGNIVKMWRYIQDGVKTKNGKQITEDLDAYELFMQALGFTPTQVQKASARAGARKEIVDKVIARRQAFFQDAYAAWSQGDQEGYIKALQDISKWNKTQTAAEFNATIDWDELEQSFKQRGRAEEEALDGVSIPKRYREGAVSRVKQ